MLNTLKDKISIFNSELAYRLALLKHQPNLPVLETGDRLILNVLKQEGAYVTSLAELGFTSNSNLLQASHSQLSTMATPNNDNLTKRLPQIFTVTDLSVFSTWGSNHRLLKIIENYIGLPVSFQGVHLRKDLPNDNQFGTLLWHKDSEDRRMVKIIIYLTDVEEKHGPFEYVPTSLTHSSIFKSWQIDNHLRQSGYLGINDQQLKQIVPKSAWKSCPGKAGTVIFVDPRNVLHHGTLRTEERSALFFVYTANPPKRPELCTQYWDATFARPELQSSLNPVKVAG